MSNNVNNNDDTVTYLQDYRLDLFYLFLGVPTLALQFSHTHIYAIVTFICFNYAFI